MTKETRVYLIFLENDLSGVEVGDWNELTDEQWINLSEEQGTVLSLEGFQRAFNKEEVPYDTYIRFITISLD
jgi:hypothetical protein